MSKRSKKTRHKTRIIFEFSFYVSLLYVLWRILFTIPFHFGIVAFISGILLLIAEVAGIFDFMCSFMIMSALKDYPLPKIQDDWEWPDVDIFIATYNENNTLLYKTIYGCKHMEYPDPQKVHIYLCDDGHREEVKRLADHMNVHYLNREDHEGAKAGNLNNALKHSSSPYIVTFDADMIPRSSFLIKTIPYFIAAERANQKVPKSERIELGFQQTPQCFYNWDLFQSRFYAEEDLANEQDYFYRYIEVAKTQFNAVIYGGSNTIIARKALEKVGGFYTKAITEDFATGLLIEGNGFVALGTGEPLASGLSPTDLPSLIQQRIRWGRGCIYVFHNIPFFWKRNYSVAQKLNYWSSISYWLSPVTRLIYFMVPILAGLFRIRVVDTSLLAAIGFWLLLFITNALAIGYLSNQVRTSRWTNIYDSILFPFLVGPIVLELFGLELKTFKVTDKDTENDSGFTWKYTWPFALLFTLNILAILRVLYSFLILHQYTDTVTFFWLLYNQMLATMSLLFMFGRNSKSMTTLRKAAIYIEGHQQDKTYTGSICGLSEYEMQIIWDRNAQKPENGPINLTVEDVDGKQVVLKATIVSTDLRHDLWISEATIDQMEELNFDTLLNLVYDRISEPDHYNSKSIFSEIFRYLHGRSSRTRENHHSH